MLTQAGDRYIISNFVSIAASHCSHSFQYEEASDKLLENTYLVETHFGNVERQLGVTTHDSFTSMRPRSLGDRNYEKNRGSTALTFIVGRMIDTSLRSSSARAPHGKHAEAILTLARNGKKNLQPTAPPAANLEKKIRMLHANANDKCSSLLMAIKNREAGCDVKITPGMRFPRKALLLSGGRALSANKGAILLRLEKSPPEPPIVECTVVEADQNIDYTGRCKDECSTYRYLEPIVP